MYINEFRGYEVSIGFYQYLSSCGEWISFRASSDELTAVKMKFRTRYIALNRNTLELSIKDETTEEDVKEYRALIYKIRQKEDSERKQREDGAIMDNEKYKCNECGREFNVPVTICSPCRQKETETERRIRNSPRHSDGMPMMYSEAWYDLERRMSDCDD